MGQAERKRRLLERTWGKGKEGGRQVKRRRQEAERTGEEEAGREKCSGQAEAGLGVPWQGGGQPQAHLSEVLEAPWAWQP